MFLLLSFYILVLLITLLIEELIQLNSQFIFFFPTQRFILICLIKTAFMLKIILTICHYKMF